MKIRITNELLWLNLLVILLIAAIIFFPLNAVRVVLGLPFILFLPGYVLMAALFPKRARMSGIERAALSLGLSIAVVPLIGLVLSYTPWGIRLEPILYSIASFIFIMSVIAWLRRRKLPKEERFGIEFSLTLPGWSGGIWDKVLSIILLLTIMGALGILGYVVAVPKAGEKFTEFYILGLEGKAADYPRELAVGEEGKVTMDIINREHEAVTYRVEVRIDGVTNTQVKPIVLEHDEKWEGEIGFVPEVAGKNQKVEFLLYKNEETKPCSGPLYLWVDVTE